MLSAVVVGLIAAGCSSGDDSSSSASTAAATSAAASTTAASAAATTAAPGTTAAAAPTTAAPTTTKFVKIDGVPGVTDDEIRFAALGTATANNPQGNCYLECFTDGIKAYFAYKNSIGGVLGRKLVLSDSLNDEIGKGQQLALKIIDEKKAFGVFATPLIPTPLNDLFKENIPVYAYLTFPAVTSNVQLFGSPSPTCVDCVRIDDPYIAKSVGATKVGSLGYSVDSSATCANGVKTTFEKYGAAVGGASVVYLNAGLPFGLANGVAPEVSAMKDAGVQVVFTCMDANGVKSIGEEMKRQGLNAVLVQNSSYDEEFFSANAEAYEGAVVQTSFVPTWSTSASKSRALFDDWLKKSGATKQPEITAHGWVVAQLAAEGIEKAGAPFDRASVVKATNSITDFTADGLIATWNVGVTRGVTPDNIATNGPIPYCRITMQIKGGKPQPLAPATADNPWTCWEGESPAAYAEPTAKSFG